MMNYKWKFNVSDESIGLVRKLADGINSRVFAGEHVTISVVTVEPNVKGKTHSHPEEQWGILMAGECTRVQGGESIPMKKGDFWHTPGNVSHCIVTGEKGVLIIDIFAPPRKEYLKPGSGYGNVND